MNNSERKDSEAESMKELAVTAGQPEAPRLLAMSFAAPSGLTVNSQP